MYFLQPITSSLATAGVWHSGISWNNTTTNTTYRSPPLASATATPQNVVEITVGAAGQLLFNPESVTVMIGTTLRFNFLGRNHTLTQSSVEHPCLNASRFDTGFHQVNPSNQSGKYLIDYKVTSTEPQWFYCAQVLPSHCNSGMVFSLNPGIGHKEFADKAKTSSTNVPQTTSAPVSCSQPSNFSSIQTSSLSLHYSKPNATSIIPDISNMGGRLTFDAYYGLLVVLLVLGL